MPKTLNLSQTYLYGGRHYGPGPTEVPDAAVAALEAREQARQPAPPAEPTGTAPPKKPRTRRV